MDPVAITMIYHHHGLFTRILGAQA